MESKVIVIHHGSHSLKIGLASDSIPKTIPNFIARKRKDLTKPIATTTTTTTPNTTNTTTTTTTTTTTATTETGITIELNKKDETSTETTQTTGTTENLNQDDNKMKIDEKTETTEPSMDIDNKLENTTSTTTSITEPISTTKIHVPRKLLEEVEISVKETTKLLPPVDYIKVRQKPILYNENNSTTFEIVKKKKKKTTTPTTTTTTTINNTVYTPPILNYNEIDYCIGEDAITVGRDKNKWVTYQPVTMSTFNSGIYNSVQSMYDDITQMWKYAIQRYLNIPSSDLSSYGCVYVVTDNIDKKSLKQITTLILKELQFTSVLFFQESICSTFGVSMSSQSCVVDIGHQKISIACIDEGYLLPNTRITLGYGGEQLTKLLEYLLTGMDRSDIDSRLTISKQIHKYYFPFKSSPNEIIDFSPFYLNVFDNIKIENLDFNYNDFQKQRVGSFKVKDIKKEKVLNTYHFNADEVYQVVGMSLFHPNVLTQFGGSSVNYIVKSKPLFVNNGATTNGSNITVEDQKHYYNYYISSYDYEDAFDSHIYTTAIGINNKADIATTATTITSTSSSSSSTTTTSGSSTSPTKKIKVNKNSINDEYIDISLDLAINKSVSLLERSDINKKKYLSNILLVGGGALIPGIQDVLRVRVYKQLEQQYQQQQLQLQLQQQQLQQQLQQQNLNSSTNSTPTITTTPIIPPLENYIGFAGSASIRTDVDARHASWRGGAILGCLESSKEIWITRNEWQDGKNSSALNKLPF